MPNTHPPTPNTQRLAPNAYLLWQERLAVATAFLCNGIAMACWVSRIPTIQQQLGLSKSVLGLALLGVAGGALLAMLLTGWLMERFGSRTVVGLGLLVMCLALPLPALAPHVALLAGALVLFGAGVGGMDVAMNGAAVVVERHWQKPLMSSFHALWSIGGMIGASVGAGLAHRGVTPLAHFTGAALLLGAIGLVAVWYLPTKASEEGIHETANAEKRPILVFPPRSLWGIGCITFCAYLSEGAMADWSGVYLHQELKVEEGIAATGYAAFSLMMALGRLGGDLWVARQGPTRAVFLGGLLASLALGTALLLAQFWAMMVGLALIGAGLSVIVPVAFSASGNAPDISTGRGIAAVATTGYFGFLLGPPLIGFVADLVTLRGAFGLVVLLIAAIVGLSRSVVYAQGR